MGRRRSILIEASGGGMGEGRSKGKTEKADNISNVNKISNKSEVLNINNKQKLM